MRRPAILLALVTLALLAVAPRALAQRGTREPGSMRAMGLDVAIPGGAPRERAERVLASLTRPGARWALDRVTRVHGLDVVRFHRERDGLEVLGASAVVQLGAEGRVRSVAWSADPVLAIEPASIDEPEAVTRALAVAPASSWVRAARALEIAPHALIPIWRVVLRGARLESAREVRVDARDGSIRRVVPLAREANGRVYESDAAARAGAPSEVELFDLDGSGFLEGRDVRVWNQCDGVGGCTPGPRAMASTSGDFLFEPDPLRAGDEFAQVSAYHHVSSFLREMRARHGVALECGVLTAVSGYAPDGAPFENAFYVVGFDGGCGTLVLGQGRRGDYAYDRDIVQHEAAHAIYTALVRPAVVAPDELGSSNDPALLDEGSADYLAATLAARPVIDTYFGPEIDRRFDGAWTCADRTGEPHDDGRIWASLGWALREALGAAKADALMIATIASLESASTLRGAVETLRMTAIALDAERVLDEGDLRRVEDIIDARGLGECSRTSSLEGCAVRARWGRGTDDVFYSLRVPHDARVLRLSLRHATGSGAALVAIDRTLTWDGEIIGADHELSLGGRDVIEWSREAGLPLGSTLHIALREVRSTSARYVEVSASFETERGDTCAITVDAGGSDASPGASVRGGGCACASASPNAPMPLSWAALVVVACVISERRARRSRTRR